MRACLLSGAALFALGMAFHEYLRPIARREPEAFYGAGGPWDGTVAVSWDDVRGRFSDMHVDGRYIPPTDDWATDPRTAELATGGGQEGAEK